MDHPVGRLHRIVIRPDALRLCHLDPGGTMRLALAMLVSALASTAASAAEKLPAFPPHMDYGDAHTYLLALGYRPVPLPKDERTCTLLYPCREYPEVKTCSKAGAYHRYAFWRDKKDQLIEVRTTNRDYAFVDRVRCRANCRDIRPPVAERSSSAETRMPHIAKRTPYTQARGIMFALGYMPARLPKSERTCDFEAALRRKYPIKGDSIKTDHLFLCDFPEMETCSGTGLAHCYALWRDKSGRLVEVITTGEVDPFVDRVRCRANCP